LFAWLARLSAPARFQPAGQPTTDRKER
jgi:hypothetical protein